MADRRAAASIQGNSGEQAGDNMSKAARVWRESEERRRRVGREGKSVFNAQGMGAQAWVPNGPDDTRPPSLPLQRLRRARKLGQRFIKHVTHCRTPAVGAAHLRFHEMQEWWPYFSLRLRVDGEGQLWRPRSL